MDWLAFWVIFSQTQLVTLVSGRSRFLRFSGFHLLAAGSVQRHFVEVKYVERQNVEILIVDVKMYNYFLM
jgi:hypothetical protein